MSANAQKPVRVVVVDDTEVCRDALSAVVSATPGFDVVGDAASGQEALDLVASADPHLVLLDVRMPELDGIETARLIRRRHSDVVIVLLTATPDSSADAAPMIQDKRDVSPTWLADLWRRHGSERPNVR